MGFLNKVTLVLFSLIVLLVSIVSLGLVFGLCTVEALGGLFLAVLALPYANLCASIFLGLMIILSIRGVLVDTDKKNGMNFKDGILLENTDGKLLITKDTLQNLINNVAKEFDGVEKAYSKVQLVDKNGSLVVQIVLTVKQGTIIRELTQNIQRRIKEVVKTSSDLDVKEVNVNIRNIEKKSM